MGVKKRYLIFVFVLILLVYILIAINRGFKGDVRQENAELLFSAEYLEDKGHVELLEEYVSDVSICYLNEDNTKTLYVFSSPIFYLNERYKWKFIDTKITENMDKNSIYKYTVMSNDIKPYFPVRIEDGVRLEKTCGYEVFFESAQYDESELILRDNFIGENTNMCAYIDKREELYDIFVYPSRVGFNCEFDISSNFLDNNISFRIKLDRNTYYLKVDGGGYIAIYENGNNIEPIGVIQKPIMSVESSYIQNGEYSIDMMEPDVYLVTYNFESNVVEDNKIFISFELYRDCQPDNTLYSGLPNLEYAHLSNIYYLGNSDKYGIGKTLIRFSILNGGTYSIDSNSIIEAKYKLYTFDTEYKKYEMNYVLEDWCSITGNWNNDYLIGEKFGYVNLEGNILVCDILDALKKWDFNDCEDYGLVLSSKNAENHSLILSNDNTLYNNYSEVVFK